MIKGVGQGDVWDEFLQLALRVTGTKRKDESRRTERQGLHGNCRPAAREGSRLMAKASTHAKNAALAAIANAVRRDAAQAAGCEY